MLLGPGNARISAWAKAHPTWTPQARAYTGSGSMMRMGFFAMGWMLLAMTAFPATGSQEQLKVRITWGHAAPEIVPIYLHLVGKELELAEIAGIGLEPDDRLREAVCEASSGQGDVDGVEFTLQYAPRDVKPMEKVQRIWADLFAQSDA